MRAIVAILAVFLALEWGMHLGAKRALAAAYDTRNVSDGLEMACLSLWMGEQNRRHWERENKK